MIMSRDVHDAVDDARNGNMSSYNALPLKECTPTSGHQIWQPNVKDGEAVCLAHQSRCKVNWNAESFNADRFNGLTTNFGTPKYDVHDAVDDARNGNMSSYNALPLKECTPTSGHQIWQPNVKDGEAVCLAHQSRCKVNWNAESFGAERECNVCDYTGLHQRSFCVKCRNHKGSCCRCVGSSDWEEMQREFPEVPYGAESLTKNAVGMIVRDGDPSSPPSDIFMADDPTSAPAGNLGGPTAPGNAGVPADIGGDDLVPYDSPSAPPADVFMNAEYKNIESKPYQHLLLGVAFTVCGLYFWSTAGSYVRNWVGVRVEKYAPGLLTPTSQVILTTAALFGIIGFGWKLYGSTKGTTIGSIDGLLGGLVEPID